MSFVLRPWQLFFLILFGWINRQQQEIIEFQNAQIQALMEKMGRKRILLTDDQRRVLAVKGKALGRKTMMELTTIVTPDTILRWHRRHIAEKWDSIAAVDFTTVEVWTKRGLVTYYLLFVMHVASRRVHCAGLRTSPNERWMMQIGRKLTDPFDGLLFGTRYLLMDRDTKHCEAFRDMLEQEGTHCLRLPPRSPNLTPHIERFMRSIKEECLLKMIFFGEHPLRRGIDTYLDHYHRERNHQGLGNGLIDPEAGVGESAGEVKCRERLGGLLQYYHREAA